MAEYNLDFLKRYIPKGELISLIDSIQAEEGHYFKELLAETERRIRSVPPLYFNEELGMDAVVKLHYFGGASDFWITELDHDHLLGFGSACMTGDIADAELGYIPIAEIVKTDLLNLDLYWQEKTLAEIRKERG